jgi:hypothetical protein
LPDLRRNLPQSEELQGVLAAPTVFNEIDDTERSLSEGFPDRVPVVDNISWSEIASINDLVSAHAILFIV